jgi:hypothetical protein
MPAYFDDFEDQVGWLQADPRTNLTPERPPLTMKPRPSSVEIQHMEAAIIWPGRYIKERRAPRSGTVRRCLQMVLLPFQPIPAFLGRLDGGRHVISNPPMIGGILFRSANLAAESGSYASKYLRK